MADPLMQASSAHYADRDEMRASIDLVRAKNASTDIALIELQRDVALLEEQQRHDNEVTINGYLALFREQQRDIQRLRIGMWALFAAWVVLLLLLVLT